MTARADTSPTSDPVPLPQGFTAHTANIGIKDATTDFLVIAAQAPCAAAGVFTTSLFAGASVMISRSHLHNSQLQGFVVISKNANVATGQRGLDNANEVVNGVATAIGCASSDLLIASTGVIGRPYPMDKIRQHLSTLSTPFVGHDAAECARAIMTTDTHPKIAEATILRGDGTRESNDKASPRIVGIAKGVGMIEPNMATLITLFCTDAELDPVDLDAVFRRVIARTFNAVSIDTDTSTSDTAAIMASGAAGRVPIPAFEAALADVALSLTRMVARDGEGATKLLVVTVDGARDDSQAKLVAKSIVNSPLVKTAVHGADPNWGRVAMAIGKCSNETDIEQSAVHIGFGGQEVFPTELDAAGLVELSRYMAGDEVTIRCSLGIGTGSFTVYGCDLSAQYVRINADYTT